MKYRKKPVVVEAVQWLGHNDHEIRSFAGTKYAVFRLESQGKSLWIRTLEGDMQASLGDYIIKGVNGEYYPCKPDIFTKTYEVVGE